MRNTLILSIACIALSLGACAQSTKHQEALLAGVTGSTAENAEAVVGVWMSEQDGALLTMTEAGLFTLERGALRSIGTWTLSADESGSQLSLTNVHISAQCPDQEGVYVAEIVRNTMRLAIVKDACTGREELMSWPWTRKTADAKLDDGSR
ncbi:MAG: hypothetical protein EXS10_05925 [Phycisphaerales bacterium]|nr:hypothetical protein [Phycisphaerales bacterium]